MSKHVYEVPRENRVVSSLREARKLAAQDNSSIIIRSAKTNEALRTIRHDERVK